ncbi:phosphatase PAP2 family protein [Candidatus Sneabacter namystus]|uniref:Phosphatase PAP2 family protein n=1 Tax=Candidatus Sneabacter namystus TaxID=2601646 RepID=A0A5C0UHJ1_9RICK|nr:phosphatase PAP2 family protein [Candidatus Sneabacter namystus]QEK39598.1 phosphatase PAP2 family protein [Candidatus Sneabacter namystus]
MLNIKESFIYYVLQYNLKIFSFINGFLCESRTFIIFSKTLAVVFCVKTFVCLFFLAAIFSILFFKFQICIEPKRKNVYIQFFNFFWNLGVNFTIFFAVFYCVKYFAAVPRPYVSSTLTEGNFHSMSSFPSAHVGLVTLLALHFRLLRSSLSAVFVILVILIVAISRIALCMHYPIDVIAGAVLAILCYFLGRVVQKHLLPLCNRIRIIVYDLVF